MQWVTQPHQQQGANMNRQLRRLTVARLALSLALVGPAAVHAEESPFPQSGWHGVVPAQGTSNYSGRFDAYGYGLGYGVPDMYRPPQVQSALSSRQEQIAKRTAAKLLITPLLPILLPVALIVVAAKGIEFAATSVTAALRRRCVARVRCD
jgi:hypothetical protein